MRRRPKTAVDGLERLLSVLLEFKGNGSLVPAIAVAILAYLGQQPEHSASMGEIQRRLGISQQRTSQLCHLLKRKGSVLLTPSAKDRRSVKVQLTGKGFRLIDK